MDGHRVSYQSLFLKLLDGTPSTGPIRRACFRNLLRAKKVFFVTIDDDYVGFIAVAVIRSLLGRKTAGLFLRNMQCFRRDRPVVYPLKRLAFRLICRLPGLRLLSIIPHDLYPELREVTHDWIHDPQMWDLWVDGPPVLPDTALKRRVEQVRNRRPVLIYVGGANKRKGYDELCSMTLREPGRWLVVSAGKVAPECVKYADELRQLGMIVEDRYMRDDEIESLYGIADYAWCRYSPGYDLASGVFGRAIQTGVQPIIREGSVIDEVWRRYKLQNLSPSDIDENLVRRLMARAKKVAIASLM